MSSFKLLNTGNEPFVKKGDHILLEGNQWDSSQANKVFLVQNAQQTHIRLDRGIFSTSGTNSSETLQLDDILKTDHNDVLFELRVSIIGPAMLYIRYPSGRIRGGLEMKDYVVPNITDENLRLLGGYTEKDLEGHRLQVFEAYRHGPDFEIANFLVDGKVVLDIVVNEMVIKEEKNWNGPVITIEDDKLMRW